MAVGDPLNSATLTGAAGAVPAQAAYNPWQGVSGTALTGNGNYMPTVGGTSPAASNASLGDNSALLTSILSGQWGQPSNMLTGQGGQQPNMLLNGLQGLAGGLGGLGWKGQDWLQMLQQYQNQSGGLGGMLGNSGMY